MVQDALTTGDREGAPRDGLPPPASATARIVPWGAPSQSRWCGSARTRASPSMCEGAAGPTCRRAQGRTVDRSRAVSGRWWPSCPAESGLWLLARRGGLTEWGPGRGRMGGAVRIATATQHAVTPWQHADRAVVARRYAPGRWRRLTRGLAAARECGGRCGGVVAPRRRAGSRHRRLRRGECCRVHVGLAEGPRQPPTPQCACVSPVTRIGTARC